MSGWIGVDLDGTLAINTEDISEIGSPTNNPYGESMIDRVKYWRKDGREVRIFTARVSPIGEEEFVNEQRTLIENWCEKYIGEKLPITATKDFQMIELWDDRAIQVAHNLGTPAVEHLNNLIKSLEMENESLESENFRLNRRLNQEME